MRALAWFLFTCVAFTATVYLIGMWILGVPLRSIRSLWREALPVMYDGKEPYEQWAKKMEQARRLQAIEEEKDDS